MTDTRWPPPDFSYEAAFVPAFTMERIAARWLMTPEEFAVSRGISLAEFETFVRRRQTLIRRYVRLLDRLHQWSPRLAYALLRYVTCPLLAKAAALQEAVARDQGKPLPTSLRWSERIMGLEPLPDAESDTEDR